MRAKMLIYRRGECLKCIQDLKPIWSPEFQEKVAGSATFSRNFRKEGEMTFFNCQIRNQGLKECPAMGTPTPR